MHVDELDYELPSHLIATRPMEPRESCRLMVIHRATGQIEHRTFVDLGEYLNPGDLFVLNSARVIPARIFTILADDESRRVEILATNAGASSHCLALLHPSHSIRPQMRLLSIETRAPIQVVERSERGQWGLELEGKNMTWRTLLEREGHMPLPPYILKRRATKTDEPADRIWYQTAYADRDGAIAAPTAGLHFSREMLAALEKRGIAAARIFLKVGIGTFQPVRTRTLEEHALAPEEYEVSDETARRIATVRARKGRVIAVGTTVVRSLECCALENGEVRPSTGATDLLIAPSHRFRTVDGLVTNFHLPRTTLLALVFAFGGTELVRKAYAEAIAREYRFYSYGDAMLIL
ncbi:MAG: tRNA preQ1(34) S-adenosylmethionine ribosyltransferase-isomerase QueA [Verrucomicrobia bacterium]|nr:tRNA preQ1(34) S-adenosylmethionine ribosyltransferase-isomerase QueA [Verrucomicrobiota bacterium]